MDRIVACLFFFFFFFFFSSSSSGAAESDADPKTIRRNQEVLVHEALKWIKKLAVTTSKRPAYPEAMFYLAECYGSGALGLPIDHDRAFALYERAAKQSHATSTYRTAVCLEVGAGTRKDSGKAYQYYRKAAALGDTAAMYKLGMCLLNGLLNQQKNPREAVIWLKRACSQADESTPHALHEMGILYEGKGETNGNIIADEAYAYELFLRAAQLGYAPSQFKLGLCFEYGLLGMQVDPRRSIAWYSKAAERGDPDAELALSGWYLTGADGVLAQSDREAYLWARKAADKGLAKAEYAVGYYVEHGVGVHPDLEEARRWFLRAASQGNKRAVQRLNELNGVSKVSTSSGSGLGLGYEKEGGEGGNRPGFKRGDEKNGDCKMM
jgi:TPR repeat protein